MLKYAIEVFVTEVESETYITDLVLSVREDGDLLARSTDVDRRSHDQVGFEKMGKLGIASYSLLKESAILLWDVLSEKWGNRTPIRESSQWA